MLRAPVLVSVGAVAATVVAMGALLATASDDPNWTWLIVGTPLLAAWLLWPLLWHLEGLRLGRRQWRFDPWDRVWAILAGCLTCVLWTAVIVADASSTAALGFVWAPGLVAVPAVLVHLLLRGERLPAQEVAVEQHDA